MKEIYVNSAGGRFYWSYATDTSIAIMQVAVSVVIMQLKVSAALMQLTVSAAYMWLIIFIVIMHVGVCCNYAEHYSHDCFYFNLQVTVSITAM